MPAILCVISPKISKVEVAGSHFLPQRVVRMCKGWIRRSLGRKILFDTLNNEWMMRFTYYITLVLFAASLFVACDKSDRILIEGEIANPGNVKVVAFYEGERKLDSVFLSDVNRFKFERLATQPRLFSMRVGNNVYPLIVSPGEKLYFRADMQQNPEHYTIEGSPYPLPCRISCPLNREKRCWKIHCKGSLYSLLQANRSKKLKACVRTICLNTKRRCAIILPRRSSLLSRIPTWQVSMP